MNEREFARRMTKSFTPEVIARGMKAHIEASRSVEDWRDAEVTAVLGFSPKQAFPRFDRAAKAALEKAGLLLAPPPAVKKPVAAMTAGNTKRKTPAK